MRRGRCAALEQASGFLSYRPHRGQSRALSATGARDRDRPATHVAAEGITLPLFQGERQIVAHAEQVARTISKTEVALAM